MKQESTQKIRQIQVSEGNQPCFRTGKLYCTYADKCCWASICLEENSSHTIHIFDVKE